MDAIYWLDEAPKFEIVDGVGWCTIISGDHVFRMRTTITTLRKGYRAAGAALAVHDAMPSNVESLRERVAGGH